MKNDYFNKPLYPETEYPNGCNNSEPKANRTEQKNQQGGLFSGMGQGVQNSLFSLLLGMKNSSGNMSSILSSLGKGNPIFETLSSFQNLSSVNKKESQSSPKNIPQDEVIF